MTNLALDSEDSLSQEHVAGELRRLNELRVSQTLAELRVRVAGDSNQESDVAPVAEEPTAPMTTQRRQGVVAPDPGWNWEDDEAYAPQRSGRYKGRLQSPDPYMFSSTIWVRHDHEASARMHEDPMDRLRDLRDAQGIREDHRAIIARLNEVEECATVHILREFMSKIRKLESMFTGEDGGAITEAIRACNRRLDNHRDIMDDFQARVSTQDWYHDTSEQEGGEETENQSGIDNRPPGEAMHHHAEQ